MCAAIIASSFGGDDGDRDAAARGVDRPVGAAAVRPRRVQDAPRAARGARRSGPRRRGEPSAAPPVKTRASSAPRLAAIWATACAAPRTKTASARAARSSSVRRLEQRAQVAVAGQRGHARGVLQALRQLGLAHAEAQQPQHDVGVQGARAGGHRHPLQRRPAHRGVDRAAVAHRARRAPRAEMADHQAGTARARPAPPGPAARTTRR